MREGHGVGVCKGMTVLFSTEDKKDMEDCCGMDSHFGAFHNFLQTVFLFSSGSHCSNSVF